MKSKNPDDIIQYTMRLNLNNPEHLEVHDVLQGLNREVHKSQNNFIINALLSNIRSSSDEELLTDAAITEQRKGRYVTRRELDELIFKLKAEIMREVVAVVCSTLSRNSEVQALEATKKPDNEEVESDEEEDDTLKAIALSWS